MKYKELVFSPTGGTKKAADMFMRGWSEAFETIDLSVQDFSGAGISIESDDRVLIALPDFGGRVPAVAVERLKEVAGNGAPCVVMCVYGNRAFEDGLVEMADAATEAGFVVVAGVAAIAQHSIVPQFAAGRPDATDQENLQEFAKATIELMDKGESAVADIPGNRPYKETGPAGLVPAVSDECIMCGICAEACPVSAIDRNTFEASPDLCISCMRCIDVCPVDARSISPQVVEAIAGAIGGVASVRKEAELFA